MKNLILKLLLISFISIEFVNAQDYTKPIRCKKLKVKDFEKKSIEVVSKLASTKTISIEALKSQKVDPLKGPIGSRKLMVSCVEHAPYIDDGGERCTFKCRSGYIDNIIMIFYENFNKEISLLNIEIEKQG